MDEVKVIEIKKSIFDENNKDADNLRSDLKKRKIFLLNVMSSPGSGKTTTLIKVINALKEKQNEKYGALSKLVNAWDDLCTKIRNFFN